MKNISTILICFLICVISINDLDAQRRRRARERSTETEESSFMDKINYEIRLGNIAFGGGFALDLKPSVGYKINKYFTTGLGIRMDYDYVSNPGPFTNPDIKSNYLSYGPFALARAKVSESIYIQGEYTIYSFDTPQPPNLEVNFPSIGAGYVQGGENWKYSLEGMVILDNTAQTYLGNTVEFWFNFSKNF